MKTVRLILPFLILLLSFNIGRADVQVSSSYGMVLSSDEVKALFEKIHLKGTESYQLQDFLIEQPFKTQLQGVSLSGNYDAQMTAGSSLLSFALGAKMSSLVLRVQKISTDVVIHKVVGGVNVEIFLKGYCENVEIKSTDSADMTANVQLVTETLGLLPQLSGIVLNKLPQWDVSMGQCQGPSGYDKALQAEIRNILSNKEEMQKIITNPIALKLQNVAKSLNEKIFAPQEMVLSKFAKVLLKPDALQVLGKNNQFLLSGKATALLSSKSTGDLVVDDAAFLTRLASAEQTGIYFSQKWIQSAVVKAQSLDLLSYSFTSSSIEALKSLFSSRLFQFFLWPDLMRFAKNVQFLFEMKIGHLQKLSFVSVNDGALWYDLGATGSVNTQAPQKKGYSHYGDFGSTLKSRIWVKMYKGAAVIGAYQPKFNLTFEWDKDYLSLFNPFKNISVSYFASKIQSTLKDEKYSFAVPKIPVSDDVKLFSDAISGDSEILFLRYTAGK